MPHAVSSQVTGEEREVSFSKRREKFEVSSDIQFLIDSTLSLLKTDSFSELFRDLASRLDMIAGGASIVISEFDVQGQQLLIREVRSKDQERRLVEGILRKPLSGFSLPFPEDVREQFMPGKLVVVPGGLHELAFTKIPKFITTIIEQQLKISTVYVMAFVPEQDLLGTVALLVHRGQPLENKLLIEALISEAAVVLKRFRVEQALREAEEKYRLLFQSANEGILFLDLQGRIAMANPKIASLLGFTPEALIGRPAEELIAEPCRTEFLQRLASRREGVSGSYELQLQRKNKSLVWAQVNATPIVDASGRHIGNLKMLADITQLKRTKEELQQIVQSAPAAIFEVDFRTAKFKRVNESMTKLLGYSQEELLSMSAFNIIDEEYKDVFRQRIKEGLAGKPIKDFVEYKVRDKDGHVHWAELNVRFVYEQGHVVGETVVAHDVTERRENEERLRETNKELESYSYSISHDLRAPLRSINGFSEALMEDYYDKLDDQAKLYLTKIRRSSETMGELIDDILRLSRVMRAQLAKEPLDLSAIAGKIVRRLREAHPDRRVTVSIEEDVHAVGDPALIEIVLEVLLNNAWKFTGKTRDASITFGSKRINHDLVYFVRDTGAGFDMAYKDKLFVPFQRLHSPEEYPGTGVGLAIAQRIVKRHGGRIWAEGSPGHGATFFFTLGTD